METDHPVRRMHVNPILAIIVWIVYTGMEPMNVVHAPVVILEMESHVSEILVYPNLAIEE